MLWDIASYGIYKSSIKHSVDGGIDMREGLLYLGYSNSISDDTLEEWKIRAIEIETKAEGLKRGKTNYPIASVQALQLLELRDEKPTRKKIDEFLGSRAVRSILGKDNCFKTNNTHVMARMMGFSTYKEFVLFYDRIEKWTGDLHLSYDMYERYLDPKRELSKHKMKTLFKRLINNWKILKATDKTRGYYIAIDNVKPHYMTMSKLAQRIVADKKNSKSDRLELEFKNAMLSLKKSA
tara:strand:- start:3317 stop:4027 length:711 start_codon:yes stop_codon:yes gene_type:complete